MSYTSSYSLSVPPNIFTRCYDDEMIVCDTLLQKVYIVNEIGARIVQIIEKEELSSLEKIITILQNEYDVEFDLLSTTCQSFIAEMVLNGVVKLGTNNIDAIPKNETLSIGFSEHDCELLFQKKMSTKQTLYSALIELTYKCNLACKHCYVNGNTFPVPELTTNRIFSLLDELYDNNIFRLVFTGGEVFLRSDFIDILKYAISKRFLVDIYSNATLLDERMIRKISSYHIRSFHASIYSVSPKMHDYITGVESSFEKTITALRLFKACGIATNIKTTLMLFNQHELSLLAGLAKEIGATFQPSLSIEPKLNGCKQPLDLRISDFRIAREILSNEVFYQPIFRGENAQLKNSQDSICNMGRSSISIDPAGNVFACNSLRYKIGHINTQSIREIWMNSPQL